MTAGMHWIVLLVSIHLYYYSLSIKGFSHLVEVHFKKILTKCEPHDAADRDKDAVRCLNS